MKSVGPSAVFLLALALALVPPHPSRPSATWIAALPAGPAMFPAAGPPDDIFFGIGGQIVTWEVGCGFAVDGPGSEITVY